ncbi:MAG: rhodanese-like domain-containing protein [Chthoniobacteraceae bacterium]
MLRLSNAALRRAGCQAVALVALAACGAGITAWIRGGLPQKPEPEPQEIALEEAMREKPLWIDARPRTDYEVEHIPGALLLNVAEWDQALPALLEKWEPGRAVVVYCASPAQADSREVAGRLRDFNLGTVGILQGGWNTWKSR